MKTWTFTIPGPLLGYRASVRRCFDPKWKRFKRMVRLVANTAGVPSEATETMSISVEIRWKKKARIDGNNILKGVEDSLFAQDRLLAGGSWIRHLKAGEECAVVIVSEK